MDYSMSNSLNSEPMFTVNRTGLIHWWVDSFPALNPQQVHVREKFPFVYNAWYGGMLKFLFSFHSISFPFVWITYLSISWCNAPTTSGGTRWAFFQHWIINFQQSVRDGYVVIVIVGVFERILHAVAWIEYLICFDALFLSAFEKKKREEFWRVN